MSSNIFSSNKPPFLKKYEPIPANFTKKNRNSISKVFLVPASSLTFEGGEAGHSAVDLVQKVQFNYAHNFFIHIVPYFAKILLKLF